MCHFDLTSKRDSVCFRKCPCATQGLRILTLCELFILLNRSLSKRAAGSGGLERGLRPGDHRLSWGHRPMTRCRAQASHFTSPRLPLLVYERTSKASSICKSVVLREHLFYIMKASFNKNLSKYKASFRLHAFLTCKCSAQRLILKV